MSRPDPPDIPHDAARAVVPPHARLAVQLLVLLAAWLVLVLLHRHNDGLWFQGDAPRHAANGLFWKDFLLSGDWLAPRDYALRYFARYPVIHPIAYPPLFYLLEALVSFALPGALAGKALVLGFALLAAVYVMLWLRRWVSAHVGALAALLLLLPGVVEWSHVVMLNVPAMALCLAALYHGRRWMEATDAPARRRQLSLAAMWSVLAFYTYLPAGVVAIIILTWLLAQGRWTLLAERRTWLVIVLAVLVALPWLYVLWRWVPTQLSLAQPAALLPSTPGSAPGSAPAPGSGEERVAADIWRHWRYYPARIADLISPYLLIIAALGTLLGLAARRTRREVVLALLWLLVMYGVFSVMHAKEVRYILLAAAPLLVLCAIAFVRCGELLSHRTSPRTVMTLGVTVAACWLGGQGWLASRMPVRQVSGFAELADYARQIAPDGPVLYDGHHAGVFTFYVRAADAHFHRQVVTGDKLLYATALYAWRHVEQYADTPEQVRKTLRDEGGCEYLFIEFGRWSEHFPAARLLRRTVRGEGFELVRTFEVQGRHIHHVAVYRLTDPVRPQTTWTLPFPALGDDATYKVKPIER